MAIKFITFDFWDTLYQDDSDEPKRTAKGMLSKQGERVKLVCDALSHRDKGEIEKAYVETNNAFRDVWKNEHRTWSVDKRLRNLFDRLKEDPANVDWSALIEAHEEMELRVQPDPIVGALETVSKLSKNYQLGIISDTIFSPGRVVRQIVDQGGFLKYFSHFVFSDEVGASKPGAKVFRSALKQSGVEPTEWVHIGDRESNDVLGPIENMGRAILATMYIDRGSKDTQASAICDDYSRLEGILEEMDLIGV